MAFNSLKFLIFFPIVVLIYYCIPRRIKQTWLLIVSYFFYMCWNALYVLLILSSTVVTFISGLLMEKFEHSDKSNDERIRLKKRTVAGSLVINLGILFFFKYLNFSTDIIQDIFSVFGMHLNIPKFDIILPVGISFYTFQALGYTMDVYRGEINAEKNFLRYALFVSFFPQLVAGPIERSKNLLGQLEEPKEFSFSRAVDGFMLMLWGYFLKLVLADRIAVYVDTVYDDPAGFPGVYLIVATIMFAFQIYCDFAGYSTIAMGAAEILGVNLMENFNAPYLTGTVSEFWRKWHISLTSWFKDYLYIPLGGSRKGKMRKNCNRMIVFLASGLWHGADLAYLVWGGLNGLYQMIGEILSPIRNRIVRLLHLNRDSLGHRILHVAGTFVLIDFSWIFFRANSLSEACRIISSMIHVRNPWILFDGSMYSCGLDEKNFGLILISILILFIADFCKTKSICIRDVILQQDLWFKCIFISVAINFILLFGMWGPSFNRMNFIYFQF